jgi:hypothetical protein
MEARSFAGRQRNGEEEKIEAEARSRREEEEDRVLIADWRRKPVKH